MRLSSGVSICVIRILIGQVQGQIRRRQQRARLLRPFDEDQRLRLLQYLPKARVLPILILAKSIKIKVMQV